MFIQEEIRKRIANILEIPVLDLDVNAEMNEISEWDSMRNVMIIADIESYYDVIIPEDDIFDLVSVASIAAEVEKLKG